MSTCGWYTWFRYWSSAADVLWTSVMCVGCEEVVGYVRCVCVWLGAAWVEMGVSG